MHVLVNFVTNTHLISRTMQNLLEIILLAIVQGIGEFLPISSSGHINVTNDWMVRLGSVPLPEPLLVNILLHFGTLFSILVVFRKRIYATRPIWKKAFVFRKRIYALLKEDRRVIPLIVVGSIPAVIVGFPMEKYCEELLESPLLTGFCFLGTAALLLFSAQKQKTETGSVVCKDMSYRTALTIGIFQAIAILPGFSRSGFTIVGGLLCKLRRDEAATFSFLLAIPIIGGVGLLKIVKMILNYDPAQMEGLVVYSIGMVVSFFVGVASLVWLMKWLQRGKLHYFAYWLLILAPITIFLSLCYPVSEKDFPPEEPAQAASAFSFGNVASAQEIDSTRQRNREIVNRWKTERDGQIVENENAEQPNSLFRPNADSEEDDSEYDFEMDEDRKSVV